MASFSIKKRTLKSGEPRFTVDIVVKKNSAIIHRESKTFRKKELARTYALKRVSELEDPNFSHQKSVPLYVLLDMFIGDRDLWDKTGRTKQYVIRMLRDCDIAQIQSDQLKISDLIEHCRNRKGAGAQPATIYHDVAYLRSVMKKASPVFNISTNHDIFNEAVSVLVDMGLIGRSQRRTRRPTSNELDRLREGQLERRTA